MGNCDLSIVIPIAIINILTFILGAFLYNFITRCLKRKSRKHHRKRTTHVNKVNSDDLVDEVSIDYELSIPEGNSEIIVEDDLSEIIKSTRDNQITSERDKLSGHQSSMETMAENMINISNQLKQNLESQDLTPEKKELLKMFDQIPQFFSQIIDSTDEELDVMIKNSSLLNNFPLTSENNQLLTDEQRDKLLENTLNSI